MITYTEDERVSGVTLAISPDKAKAAKAELVRLTTQMDSNGLWYTAGEHTEVWRNRVAKMELKYSDDVLLVTYEGVASHQRETREWLEKDPDNRYPNVVSLQVGRASVDDVLKRLEGNKSCKISKPIAVDRVGTFTLVLHGECFGLPKEVGSLLWFDQDLHRLYRLNIFTNSNEAVKAAMSKHYNLSEGACSCPSVSTQCFCYKANGGASPGGKVYLPEIALIDGESWFKDVFKDGSWYFSASFDVFTSGFASAEAEWQGLMKYQKKDEQLNHLFD